MSKTQREERESEHLEALDLLLALPLMYKEQEKHTGLMATHVY